jgi:hypothetical protein
MLNLDDDERVSEILPVEDFSDDKLFLWQQKKALPKKQT